MTDTISIESTKMVYIRNEQGHYVCPVCDTVKVKQNTMHYHMIKCQLKRTPIEDRPSHACEFCVAAPPFLTADALGLHLARMSNRSGHPDIDVKDIECPFNECTFHDMNRGNVRTHCMRKHLTREVKALLERNENNQVVCTNCHVIFKSLGSFYYHSIGCVSLPLTDERHALLAQLS